MIVCIPCCVVLLPAAFVRLLGFVAVLRVHLFYPRQADHHCECLIQDVDYHLRARVDEHLYTTVAGIPRQNFGQCELDMGQAHTLVDQLALVRFDRHPNTNVLMHNFILLALDNLRHLRWHG